MTHSLTDLIAAGRVARMHSGKVHIFPPAGKFFSLCGSEGRPVPYCGIGADKPGRNFRGAVITSEDATPQNSSVCQKCAKGYGVEL